MEKKAVEERRAAEERKAAEEKAAVERAAKEKAPKLPPNGPGSYVDSAPEAGSQLDPEADFQRGPKLGGFGPQSCLPAGYPQLLPRLLNHT